MGGWAYLVLCVLVVPWHEVFCLGGKELVAAGQREIEGEGCGCLGSIRSSAGQQGRRGRFVQCSVRTWATVACKGKEERCL